MKATQQLSGFAQAANKSNSYWFMGTLLTFYATGKETKGQFSVFEALVPGDYEVPAHTHSREDESFYIIEGELECSVGKKILHGKAGDFIFLPRNVQHSWKSTTDPARFLVWINPAGQEEAFLALSEVAREMRLPPNEPISEDLMQRAVELDNAYGITYAFQNE